MEPRARLQGVKPDSAEILKVVRRDIELLLLPELTSDYARTVAAQIDTSLRHLITREEQLEPLLRELNEKYEALFDPPASAPDQTGNDGNAVDRRWDRAAEAAGRMEATLIARMREDARTRPPMAPITDALCVQAIKAETAFAQAVLDHENGLAHPVYSKKEADALAVTPESMTAYFSERLPDRPGLAVTRIEKILGGFSKETYFIDLESEAGAESVVVRRDNPHGCVDSSVADEFALLSALHGKGIAVARPLLIENDPSIMGHPFMVMEKLPGASQLATAGITVDARHVAAAKGLAEVLASIHRIDPAELDLPRNIYDPALTTADYLHRYLDHYEAVWHRTRLKPSPTLTCAFEWLRQNMPESELAPRVVHGDAGLHNLLMHEGKVSAMLDWELAHFGDPTEDLVYCRLWIDSVIPWKDFLAHYYLHGGPEYTEHKAMYYANQAKLLHCTFGIKAMRGFMETSNPELNLLYPKLKMTRVFQNLLAASITGR